MKELLDGAERHSVKVSVRLALLATLLFAQACGSAVPTEPGAPAVPTSEVAALVDRLQRQNATVSAAEVMPASAYSFFGVQPTRFLVNSENLYVFEYSSAAATSSEAGRIAADGSSVGTTHVDWISAPHFYRSGRLIVLYVGNSASMLALLQGVIGPQIAGR